MRYEAPAKLNLNLLVSSVDRNGMHPLRSVVQTIEWCDTLEVSESDDDSLSVEPESDDVPGDGDNLVTRAVEAVRHSFTVPPLGVTLEKSIPVAAGLGGGSADAAAALMAAAEIAGIDKTDIVPIAGRIGADVTFALTGGTALMSGHGERIEPMALLSDFAVAVVVPEIRISTSAAYRRWDELGEPEGFAVPDRLLPPQLRHEFPIRNDLYRAAVDLEPALGDFVSDVARSWDTVVMMTGSGSGCFAYFSTVDEASEAASSVSGTRAAKGVEFRPTGVRRVE